MASDDLWRPVIDELLYTFLHHFRTGEPAAFCWYPAAGSSHAALLSADFWPLSRPRGSRLARCLVLASLHVLAIRTCKNSFSYRLERGLLAIRTCKNSFSYQLERGHVCACAEALQTYRESLVCNHEPRASGSDHVRGGMQ